jgi:hypothetical protein
MAFISALTGLRFVDIQTLPFCNIYSDIHQRYIKVREKKTETCIIIHQKGSEYYKLTAKAERTCL